MEVWILTALAAAGFSSVKAAIQKYLTDDYDSIDIGYMRSILSLIFLLPVAVGVYIYSGITLQVPAVLGALVSGLGNVLGIYLMLEAFAIEDISVVSPLRRTTPVWVALVEPLLLEFSYSPLTVAGAAVAVAGGYVVLAENGNLLEPLKPSRGALLALSVSFIIAGVALAERFATQRINPLVFTFLVYVVMSVSFTVLARKNSTSVGRSDFLRREVLAVGLVAALGSLFIFYSFSLAAASKVVTVKQSVIVFNVLIGGIYFREQDIPRKLLGSLLVIAGIVLVI